MPVQVVPPMYNMLADEIKWALADVRYCFSALQFSFSDVFFLGSRENHITLRISSSFLVFTTFPKKKNRN